MLFASRERSASVIFALNYAKYDPTRVYRHQRDTPAKQRLNCYVLLFLVTWRHSHVSPWSIIMLVRTERERTTGHFPRTTQRIGKSNNDRSIDRQSRVLNIQNVGKYARPWHAPQSLQSPRWRWVCSDLQVLECLFALIFTFHSYLLGN